MKSFFLEEINNARFSEIKRISKSLIKYLPDLRPKYEGFGEYMESVVFISYNFLGDIIYDDKVATIRSISLIKYSEELAKKTIALEEDTFFIRINIQFLDDSKVTHIYYSVKDDSFLNVREEKIEHFTNSKHFAAFLKEFAKICNTKSKMTLKRILKA